MIPYFNFIDLHSDTATALYRNKQGLRENDLHISLEKIKSYPHYAQVFAIFTSKKYSDEDGYGFFLSVRDAFLKELSVNEDRISFVKDYRDLMEAWETKKAGAFLAIEDARILNGDLTRVKAVADLGVRFMTLTWAGETCIGGSWDTCHGLTDFGKEVVQECFRVGIVPDVSHASEETIDDVIELARESGKSFIATHSNARGIYPHHRNLTDRHFLEIKNCQGLVGMNMYDGHLADTKATPATLETIFSHIDHFMSLGGENTVAFGCDFDGASFPKEIKDASEVAKIAEILLSHNYPESLVEKIFWKNAQDFLRRSF